MRFIFSIVLWLIFINSSLAQPPTADCSDPCDGIPITFCREQTSLEACIKHNSGTCFWDEEDNRCESRYNREDRCNQFVNLSECVNSAWNCFWDTSDQRCESR